MKIFVACVCLVCSLLLFVRMFQNIRLNQALQLKKETLGYVSVNKVSYKKSIPYLSLLVLGFVLLLPDLVNEEPTLQVATFQRDIPAESQNSILLNGNVELVASTQELDNKEIIGTMMVFDAQYQVVIDRNQLFYLDSEGNIYENRHEE